MTSEITTTWNGESYEYEFQAQKDYQGIANYLQACASILENDDNFDGKVRFSFRVARADIPYSTTRDVNGWRMPLPAGVTTRHPDNPDIPLIVIQEGLYENGHYREFMGTLTHEVVHLMFPGLDENGIQRKSIKLLQLIDQNLEKFNSNPDVIREVLIDLKGSDNFKTLDRKAIQGGIEYLEHGLENLSYFQ